MSIHDDKPLYAVINAKLASVVAGLPTRPAWYDTWQSLGPDNTEELRLQVYREIRESGVLPQEAGFFLVSWQIDAIASELAGVALCDLEEQMTAMERAGGLNEDEFWTPLEAPEEYEALRQQYQDAWDQLFVDELKHRGEHEMAQLFVADHDGFHDRSEEGRQYFHGPDDPEAWLDELRDNVGACMTADSPMGPLGGRFGEDDGFWEVFIYPTPIELVGGAEDGEILAPSFSLDLERLQSLFERIDSCSWQSLGLRGSEGPCISIEGLYQGHEVLLQVLAYAPDDEEPGLKVKTN